MRPRWTPLLYAGLLAAILVCAAVLRFRLPPTPLFDGDSWGYLNPGFSKLSGGTFEHTFGRNFVYPGFIFAVLCLCGNYDALTVVQHALGLLTGVVLAGAWNALCACLVVGERARTAARFFGLLLVADYLFSRNPVLFEHTIRPEAVYPLVLAWILLLNLDALHAVWIVPRPALARRALGVGLVASYLALSLKPSFGFGVVAANLPLWFWLCRRGETWWVKARVVGLALGFIAVTMFLPERLLAGRDGTATTFLSTTLFTIHAKIIQPQIADDLRAGAAAPYPSGWLASFDRKLTTSLAAAARPENNPWASLGFNADYLLYGNPVFDPFFGPGHEREEAAFCRHYYARAFLRRPGAMLAKIGAELKLVYGLHLRRLRPGRLLVIVDPYTGKVQRPMSYDYLTAAHYLDNPTVSANLPRSVYGKLFAKRVRALHKTKALVRQYPWVGILNNLLSGLHLPLLLAALAGGIIMLWQCGQHPLAPFVAGVWLVWIVNFGVFLTFAVVHILDTDRYRENQQICTAFGEFAALLLLAQWVAVLRRPRGLMPPPPASPPLP